jgi:hypothetical protein
MKKTTYGVAAVHIWHFPFSRAAEKAIELKSKQNQSQRLPRKNMLHLE